MSQFTLFYPQDISIIIIIIIIVIIIIIIIIIIIRCTVYSINMETWTV